MTDQISASSPPKTSATLIGLGIVVAVFLVPIRADLLKPIIPMEEGSVLVDPERILAGDIPNKDFETMYGPGNLWFLAGVSKAFGSTVIVERSVGLAYRFALVLALFLIGRRYGLAIGVAAALIVTLLTVGTWAVAYAWFGGLALAAWSLYAVTQRRWLLLGGVLGGLALVFRPDLVIAIAALMLVCRSRRFSIGVLAGLLPYVVLIVSAGPRAVIEGTILDPIFRINPGRRFPIPWTSPLLWLVVGSTALLAWSAWTSHRRSGDTSLLACAGFSVALLPYALQRADDFHLASAGCVAIALLPAAITVLIGEDSRRVAVPIACLIVVLSTWGSALRGTMESVGQTIGVGTPPSYPLTFDGRTVPVPLMSQVEQLSGLLRAIQNSTEPGDRIFVGPSDLSNTVYNDTFLYYLVPELTPASYFLEMNPGTADRPGSRLKNDISTADVIVVTTRYDDWGTPNRSGTPDPRGVSIDQSDFCAQSRFGPWRLYVRCAEGQ
jgi:hypothetical protein